MSYAPPVPPIEMGSFWLPRQTSTIAAEIDTGWDAAMLVSIALFILVMAAMTYLIIRYRRRTDNDKTSGIDHSLPLEVTWSVIPLIIVLALFGVGLKGYVHTAVAPAESYEINVTAEMYLWTFTYPNGTVSVNELAVPKGRPVKLIMSSKDVVHSFYVPEFRVKQDLVPNAYTTIWFEANEAKETVLECTEYCGVGHSEMFAKVTILEQPKFDEWLEKGGGGNDLPPAELGQKLYATRSCATCHSLDGTRIQGPSFKGAFGRTETLSDGSQVKVDENYIRESILNPQAKIVQGYPPTMPTFQGLLKDREIDAIIAFLKTQN